MLKQCLDYIASLLSQCISMGKMSTDSKLCKVMVRALQDVWGFGSLDDLRTARLHPVW